MKDLVVTRWTLVLHIQVDPHTRPRTPISAGNMLQDLRRLCETTDNAKCYI